MSSRTLPVVSLGLITLLCTVASAPARAQNPIIEGNIAYFVEGTPLDSNGTPIFVPTESFGGNNPAGGKDIVLGKRPGGMFANAAGDTDITDPYSVYLTHSVFPNFIDDGYSGLDVYNNASLSLYRPWDKAYGVLVLTTHDSSRAQLSGVFALSQANLNLRDQSQLDFGGTGDSTYADCGDDSTFRYWGADDTVTGELHYASVYDNATFTIPMGSLTSTYLRQQISTVDVFGNGTVNANAGYIRRASVGDNAVFNLNGGQLQQLIAGGNSTINLRYQTGGDISLFGNSKLNVYGKNLRLALLGDGRYGIEGELLDAPFAPFGSLNIYTDPSLVGDPTLGLSNWGNIRFINTAGNVTAPEPGTLVLLGSLGTAFPVWRRLRRSR